MTATPNNSGDLSEIIDLDELPVIFPLVLLEDFESFIPYVSIITKLQTVVNAFYCVVYFMCFSTHCNISHFTKSLFIISNKTN